VSAERLEEAERPPALLLVRGLSYLYRAQKGSGARGLRALSLEVRPGEVVGLLGPNGAGKSTAFELISGERRPQSGEVYLKGVRLGRLPLWRRARLGLAYLSQRPALFERLTVRENITLAMSWSVHSEEERQRLANQLLMELALSSQASQRAELLSGGERQRLALARLLATRPSLFLLDEPFAALDPRALDAMRELIFMLKERGVGVLITDHRATQTLSICDRVYILYEGELITTGTPSEVLHHPTAKAVYLGDSLSALPSTFSR